MSKRLLSVLIAGLFASAPALAQVQTGDVLWHGSIGIGGIGSNIDDNGDKAKVEEYRDLSGGVTEVIDVRARSGRTWADIFIENIGRDDFYGSIRGGQYDLWKGRIYSDWLRHRFVDNARSPFDGLGTNALRTTFPRADVANWNSWDVNYKRKDTGGFFEWQGLSPWYFRADGQQIKFEGTKLLAGSNGSSPGNGFTDLIAPVDWKTDTWTVEGGYNTKTMHFAVSWMYSKFNNDNDALTWTNPFFANGIDTTHLPSENKTNRFAANATFRQLPYNSTAAFRYTWQEVKSDVTPWTQVLSGVTGTPAAPVFSPTGATEADFHGKHNFQTFTAALASVPMQNLDTRLYYNYYRLKNESNDIEFFGNLAGSPGAIPGRPTVACAGGPCEGEHFGYTKHNFGFDAYWKVARGHRVGAGWDYVDRDLEHRTDYDNSRENKLFAEYKNTQLENFVGRIKYTYLQRRADFLRHEEGANANDPLFLERFVGRFDLMDLNQNNLKVQLDWSPMPLLDLSAEYNWKENKYKDQPLGRNKDVRDEVYVAAYFGDPNTVRMTVYGDWETIKYDSTHRNVGSGSCTSGGPPVPGPNCFDPFRAEPPVSTAYNWKAKVKDRNWSAGVGVDWRAMANLLVKGSYLYYETDGSSDMQSQNAAGEFGSGSTTFFGNPLPIPAYDDTKKHSFNLKGIYTVNKNWSVTAGYAYEKYEYTDTRYEGYQYTIPFPAVTNNASQSYLSGYNAFTPYKANIFYGMVTYRF